MLSRISKPISQMMVRSAWRVSCWVRRGVRGGALRQQAKRTSTQCGAWPRPDGEHEHHLRQQAS